MRPSAIQDRRRHININKFFGDCPGGGGVSRPGGGGLPTGGQGSKVYVLCAEPKEHKRFRPGTRPGGIGFPAGRIGDRGDREIVYVQIVDVPFLAPSNAVGRCTGVPGPTCSSPGTHFGNL